MNKSNISKNFKEATSEYKGFSYCEGYDFEEFSDENTDAPLSEPTFQRRLKMLSRPDGVLLYGKLEIVVFSACFIQL